MRRVATDGTPDAPRSLVAALADATPPSRDRTVDALRALSIGVVVLWHWVFSVTHFDSEGRLAMPNPVGDVPGLWMATWVLQVMPLFFLVGGFSNLAGWDAAIRSGGSRSGDRAFLRTRVTRLVRPAALLPGVWAAVETVRIALAPGLPAVWRWGGVVFVPLWFLGVYLLVVLAVPLTARLHRHAGLAAVAGLAGVIAAGDVARLHYGLQGPTVGGTSSVGLAGSLAVWLFAHQLGYFWRDGRLTQRRAAVVAATGLGVLALLTGLGPYPRSMVAVRGEASNLFPTAAPVAALAVFHLGLAVLARRPLERWLRRPAAWRATVAVNAVAMTVFCWHMTALVVAIGAWRLAGGGLGAEPTGSWWFTRPLWVILPGVALAPMVAAFWRVERPRDVARP